MKNAGRIGATGAGIYAMDLWKRALLEADLEVLLLHNHYCLNDIRALELLPLCRQREVGIVNASPFASGLLTDRGPAAWHPASREQRLIFARAAERCREHGTSLQKVALQFSTQSELFPTCMFSTARTASLQKNLEWYSQPVDYGLVAEIQELLEPVMNLQWEY
ncbi:MAG: hypothetical protein EA383_00770 [Spirochaetaceae bacterium]|nr:MAG: hypothetical protein EA383_00770 [Spirochaetaceae bacterium]